MNTYKNNENINIILKKQFKVKQNIISVHKKKKYNGKIIKKIMFKILWNPTERYIFKYPLKHTVIWYS